MYLSFHMICTAIISTSPICIYICKSVGCVAIVAHLNMSFYIIPIIPIYYRYNNEAFAVTIILATLNRLLSFLKLSNVVLFC